MNTSSASFKFSSADAAASLIKKENAWLFPLLFFILNLIIKSFSVNKVSFDLDEAWHTFFSQKSVPEVIRIASEDPNGPFYNLLLHFWIQLTGVSEFSLRYLSVIFSALTAPLIYTFGKKYFSKDTGFFSASLFSFSYIHFYYSHNARVYALICLLTIISLHLFMLLIRTKRWSVFAWFIVVNTLLVYTHLTTVFVFAAQAIAALFFFRESKRGVVLSITALVISGLLFIPWLLNSPYYTNRSPVSWMQPPNWSDVKQTLIFLFGSEKLLIIFSVLSVLPVLFLILKKIPWDVFPLYMTALLLFIVPVALNFLVSVFIVPILLPKYVLAASLGLFILAGYTLSVLPLPRYINYILLGLMLFSSAKLIGFEKFGVEPWREVVHDIKKQKTDRTMVIISPFYQYVSFAFYYNQDYFRNTDSTQRFLNSEKIFLGNDEKIVLEQPTDYDTILVLTTHQSVVDPSRLVNYMQKTFLQYADSAYGGFRLYGFRKPDGPAKFSADMESPALGFQMNNVKENAVTHSGNKVSRTDKVNTYGAAFVNKAGAFDATSDIQACLWIYRSDSAETGVIVTSLEKNNSPYQYNTLDIAGQAKSNKWTRVCCDLKIPGNAKPDDIVKIYFWNTGKSIIYVDDMEITEVKR